MNISDQLKKIELLLTQKRFGPVLPPARREINGRDVDGPPEADDDWLASWTYAKSTFSNSPPAGTPARIGFRYIGNDGAQISFELVKVCSGSAGVGDGGAADFGTNDLWSYDGSSWRKLNPWDPTELSGWGGGLAMDFDGDGLWNYDGSSWSKKTPWHCEKMGDVDLD